MQDRCGRARSARSTYAEEAHHGDPVGRRRARNRLRPPIARRGQTTTTTGRPVSVTTSVAGALRPGPGRGHPRRGACRKRPKARHAVRAYRVEDRRLDVRSRPTTASALIAVPADTPGRADTVVWEHGTHAAPDRRRVGVRRQPRPARRGAALRQPADTSRWRRVSLGAGNRSRSPPVHARADRGPGFARCRPRRARTPGRLGRAPVRRRLHQRLLPRRSGRDGAERRDAPGAGAAAARTGRDQQAGRSTWPERRCPASSTAASTRSSETSTSRTSCWRATARTASSGHRPRRSAPRTTGPCRRCSTAPTTRCRSFPSCRRLSDLLGPASRPAATSGRRSPARHRRERPDLPVGAPGPDAPVRRLRRP